MEHAPPLIGEPSPPRTTAVVRGEYVALQIYFASYASGPSVKPDKFPEFDELLKTEEQRLGRRIKRFVFVGLGNEGEWAYCMPLDGMNDDSRLRFVTELRKILKPKFGISLFENQRCVDAVYGPFEERRRASDF